MVKLSSSNVPESLEANRSGLAGWAGVKLTPAGAAFPYGADPADRNIRLAPSFPPLAEVEAATEVFVTCVELASARKRLREMNA